MITDDLNEHDFRAWEIEMTDYANEIIGEALELQKMQFDAHTLGRSVWRWGAQIDPDVLDAAAAFRAFPPATWWLHDT